jgi:hypothetical protein
MLQRILHELRTSTMPLSAALLSQRLAIEPATLEGMLYTLECKGHIVPVQSEVGGCQCAGCPLQTRCPPESTIWYALAPTSQG